MKNKRCSSCGIDLAVNLFSKNRRTADGLQNNCKTCQAAAYRAKKQEPEKCLATSTEKPAEKSLAESQVAASSAPNPKNPVNLRPKRRIEISGDDFRALQWR